MSFSSAGWDAVELRLKYSCGSLVSSRDLVRPRPSSKAALAALKFRVDRRSKAANWEVARARTDSTPALFALVICSGVRYMHVSKKGRVGLGRIRGWLRSDILRCNIRDSTDRTSRVKRDLCSATSGSAHPGKYLKKQGIRVLTRIRCQR